MKKSTLYERLEEHKKELIEAFPSLTEKDFEFENKEEMGVHIKQKLGKSENELREILRTL